MQISSADLLMYIQSISREKELPYEQVLDIFGEALAQSLHKTCAAYNKADFRVRIDPQSGDTEAFRCWRVIGEEDLLENPDSELMLETAQLKKVTPLPVKSLRSVWRMSILIFAPALWRPNNT